MKKFVIVDNNERNGEIYLNQFEGTLPPMTEQEIKEYFNDTSLLSIAMKHKVRFYELDEKHLCPKCGTPLTRSDNKDYTWQCFYCDEDFGSFDEKKQKEFYQITEKDVYSPEKPVICLGSEKAIIDFVNERNEGADELLSKVENAIEWLEDNGYEVEKRKDLIKRLEQDEQVCIQ